MNRFLGIIRTELNPEVKNIMTHDRYSRFSFGAYLSAKPGIRLKRCLRFAPFSED